MHPEICGSCIHDNHLGKRNQKEHLCLYLPLHISIYIILLNVILQKGNERVLTAASYISLSVRAAEVLNALGYST
jgi:hypothetical protein